MWSADARDAVAPWPTRLVIRPHRRIARAAPTRAVCGHGPRTRGTTLLLSRQLGARSESDRCSVCSVQTLFPDRGRVSSGANHLTAFPTFATSFDAAVAGAQGYVEGMLLPDELIDVVTQALDGRLPVGRRGCVNQPTQADDVRRWLAAKTDARVNEMIRAIDAHLGESLSVRSIAHMVRMSDSGARRQVQRSALEAHSHPFCLATRAASTRFFAPRLPIDSDR